MLVIMNFLIEILSVESIEGGGRGQRVCRPLPPLVIRTDNLPRAGRSALGRADEGVPRAVPTVVHDRRTAGDAIESHGDVVLPHREVNVGRCRPRGASESEERPLEQIIPGRDECVGIALEVRHDRLPAVAMIHDHAPAVSLHPAGEEHDSACWVEDIATRGGTPVVTDEIH